MAHKRGNRQKGRDQLDAEQMEEAQRTLSRVSAESETLMGSSLARAARQVVGHFAAADKTGAHDPIEVWGSRIGRILGLVFAIFLVVYLLVTYGL